MASIYTRSNETDSYKILNSYNSNISNTDLEVAIAQSLVEAQTINSGTYVSPANDSSWNCVQLDSTLVNTSAISNYPPNSVTEFSVISTELYTPDVSVNTYTTNISSSSCNNNVSTFSSLTTSAPFYDSNYVFTQSLLPDCSDNSISGSYVSGRFDVNATNAKIQYGMQSRWNTTKGPYNGLTTVGGDPTGMLQDFSFNTTKAFAQQGSGATDASYVSYYATVDASNGSIKFTSLDASYQPIQNNLLVGVRNIANESLNSNDDVGIFRIQHNDNKIFTTVSLNDGSFNTVSTNDLNNMPMFNVGGGITPSSQKNNLPVPGTMNVSQFNSLFNTDVLNTIADYWTFEVDVSSNDGGYTIDFPEDPSGIPILISNLEDTDLYDNPFYMEYYVSQTHSINFSDTSLNITVGSNASISDLSSITIDLSNGETLLSNQANQNGIIAFNTNTPNTRYTDLSSVDVSNSTTPFVYYSSDSNPNTSGIDSAEMTTENFQVMWQKVAQQSSTEKASNYLLQSNNANMTLYANGIVDNCYNSVDFNFSFDNTSFNNQNVNLWEINAVNNIILNSQSFYDDQSYTIVEPGIATSGLISGLTDSVNYNSFQILLTSKVKENIGLQTAVNSVNGWELNYTDVSNTHLYTNNTNAYASETNVPVYDSTTITNINTGSDISFNYTYSTIGVANRPGGLNDYISVTYTLDSSLVQFTIPQTEITRLYTSSDVSFTLVPDTSYNFSGNIYKSQNWELVNVTANSVYNATFPAKYGPYTNLNLTVKNIQQQDIYYAIRNKTFGHFAPQSALSYIADLSGITIPNLNNVHETITPAPGNSLTISGIFNANDLKPFTSVVQGQNIDNTWSTISNSIQTDVYYGLTNSVNLIPVVGSVSYIIEYTPFTESTQQSTIVDLQQNNYYIPFVYSQENTSYILQSFNSTPDSLANTNNTNIGSSSFLNNVNYLTVENNYSSVVGWSTTTYSLTVTPSTNSTTFVVKDTSNNTVFTIVTLNNTIFLGNYVISYIPNDVYRVERVLGNTYQENFKSETYSSGSINLDTYVPGVLITSSLGSMLSNVNYRPVNGAYQNFRVLGDYMTINEVGTTYPSPTSAYELGINSYNNGSLIFQYVDNSGVNYSAAFGFAKYRGYNSYNGIQILNINRGFTVVTFDVSANIPNSKSALQNTLTSNMYYNQNFVVNNLRDAGNTLIANLNIKGFFYYSIPPTGSQLHYNVTVTGDSVNVSLNNPNYQGSETNLPVPSNATPVVNPKSYSATMTLKDFGTNNMYTFSGNWYVNNNLMSIRPSRVKLQNVAYPNSELNYRIQVITPDVIVYKPLDNTYNWLGNPALLGSQDPNTASSNWAVFKTLTAQQMYTGVNIGRKTIYQNPNLVITTYITYIVSVPSYYNFEQISTENCPVIPYNYNVDYVSNITYRYMPYLDLSNGILQSVFNPYATTKSYKDINNNTTSVITNADYLNNVTFTLNNAPSITNSVNNPNTTRYGIIVPGTNVSISLYVGLYNSTYPGSHTNPMWNAPITSIPSTPNIQISPLVLRQRDASGALYFSAIQYPADVGYPSGNQSYQQIFGTTNQSEWYNINFKIDNTSWFNNNTPVTYFDNDAAGLKPTLYTVVDINNISTQINKRRVYKYTTSISYDVDASSSILSGIQTMGFIFNSRSYADFDISLNNTFPSNPSSIWNYNNLLDNTIIPNTPITWITDTNYIGTNTYVSWSFGNSTTSQNMLVQLFGVQDTEKKWVFINLEPFTKYLNQFGLCTGGVAWDGSVITPLTQTFQVQFAPLLNTPKMGNNTYDIQQYSVSSLNNI